MTKTTATIADAGKTTHTYRVVVEPDEDAWHAWCPALQSYGAATWGGTRPRRSGISGKWSRWSSPSLSKTARLYPPMRLGAQARWFL